MFTGFNLETSTMFVGYKNIGENIFKKNKQDIRRGFEEFISEDGSINGTRMQNNWFPEVEADIFLSHSHADRDKAIGLAGFLHQEFGLNVFIDSCVWGFANNLLKQIDDEYCQNDNKTAYIYEKRNYSTSHVHAMLTTALINMIDKTECMVFLNTPKSLITTEVINQTMSPWIYTELALSQTLRRIPPERHHKILKKGKFEEGQEYKSLTITYDVRMDHLKKISQTDLEKWLQIVQLSFKNRPQRVTLHPLDILYDICGVLYNEVFKIRNR
ncbi:hypothetical protein CEQ83_26565 (plasmid) [Priestia megaterium]|uniref:toll/interleukin-1 receptor domain-containing protein n=1 Tax=Priestia megaterium TaxID=1404 RepID=UPI0012AA9A86|nr:toll/interleukin-1 receptor domain-containing protein [Priestia megaterium]QFY76106.1 hypothetical protein CEQ83_26565 [Priestia megaterium]